MSAYLFGGAYRRDGTRRASMRRSDRHAGHLERENSRRKNERIGVGFDLCRSRSASAWFGSRRTDS